MSVTMGKYQAIRDHKSENGVIARHRQQPESATISPVEAGSHPRERFSLSLLLPLLHRETPE